MMDLFKFLEIGSPIDVVDVGASLGGKKTVYHGIAEKGWAAVVGFEPSAVELEKLDAQKKPYERYFPYFVGNGETQTFYETNWPLTSSLFEPNPELLSKFNNLNEVCQITGTHAVATKRIDDIAEIANIDLFKLDIQGAELSVLQNGLTKLKDALVVQVEVEFVELYKGQPFFADVDLFMRKQGFQFHTFYSTGTLAFKPLLVGKSVNRGLRQHLWADAVYVRDWLRPESMSSEKLRKCALILGECYGSFDLAHLLLQDHDRLFGSDFAGPYLAMVLEEQTANGLALSRA
ncbi:FkbM family methyltransferase [Rhizobium sp. CG5]|uniref:FkbM family methyltransferase n=1 Tax=Rhizobium sp. CG5 TaxID=2726076 RepID=UPI0020334D1E|nr:FkbM family methyltransferase [Rhizobium sp. CG5]MCM2474777.1 FkbM family methyltransferase [Rhizobium sp. CG5]